MSKLGGEDVKRFHWSSHSTRTGEFLKKGWEKAELGNLILRCIVELLGTNQTRKLKSRKVMVIRFSWNDGCNLKDQNEVRMPE